MQKEKMKNNANPVGASITRGHVLSVAHKFAQLTDARPHFEGITKKQKGITLIALIITIIVMLILVGVTVSVALNGGLFSTAKSAANRTQIEADREELLSAVVSAIGTDGKVDFSKLPPSGWTGTNGTYTSTKGNTFTVKANGKILSEGEIDLPEEWSKAEKPAEWDNDKVVAVADEGNNIIPLPEGFSISEVKEEQTIDGGLVITDGTNEFVWIPVTENYTEDDLEPLTGTDSTSNCVLDSQEQLDYYYGEGYFNYSEDFNYAEDKTKIEASINKYKGFYVGRYETTIDEEGNIGSKVNTPVLTAEHTIKEGTNSKNNEPFYYRWYGLYKVQKDMYAGSETVFSSMITSKEWDKIMDYTGYGSATRPAATYTTQPDLSGSAYSTNPNKYDVSKNIYDLAGNVFDWTLTPKYGSVRVVRGGYCHGSNSSASSMNYDIPRSSNNLNYSAGVTR